jgi:hypothetical protein
MSYLFSPDPEEERRIEQDTLYAAAALADSSDPEASGIVGHIPIVVNNLLVMYQRLREEQS